MSFPWVYNSHSELTATIAQWAHRAISRIAQSKLIVWVANSRKAHCKLTVGVILWVYCKVTCPQNELSKSFNVISQWISCELKFFTGKVESHLHSSHPRFAFIIPLVCLQFISRHGGKCVDQMGTEPGVNVFWEELSSIWTVLGPVGVVAYPQFFP